MTKLESRPEGLLISANRARPLVPPFIITGLIAVILYLGRQPLDLTALDTLSDDVIVNCVHERIMLDNVIYTGIPHPHSS